MKTKIRRVEHSHEGKLVLTVHTYEREGDPEVLIEKVVIPEGATPKSVEKQLSEIATSHAGRHSLGEVVTEWMNEGRVFEPSYASPPKK